MHRQKQSRARKTRRDQTKPVSMAKEKDEGFQFVKEKILQHFRRNSPDADAGELEFMSELIDWVDEMPWPPPKRGS